MNQYIIDYYFITNKSKINKTKYRLQIYVFLKKNIHVIYITE